MPDEVRIGDVPPALPPARSSRLLAVAAVLVLLAGAGAWVAGSLGGGATTTTAGEMPFTTTSAAATTTTTRPLEERLDAARRFWDLLGRGGAAAAAANAFPQAGPAALDLMGFVAAFSPGFIVGECTPFAVNAVQCTVTITNGHLIAIGLGTPDERVLVDEDGWFDIPVLLGSAAARLSLYALDAHTADLRAACPVTDNPQVPRLAIAGSATPDCGAYLAGLIPEYLAAFGGGPGD